MGKLLCYNDKKRIYKVIFMILRMPAYCRNFRCIADKCKDNCCIGWEIDIDRETTEYYNNVSGVFGDKLRCNISRREPSSFILGEKERCPFLNERNLCEIILNLGEENLCGICTEHPRYYEWFDGVKEGGIGLCCEEASRIILSAEHPSEYTETEIQDEDSDIVDEILYPCLLRARDAILAHLENDSIAFGERLRGVISFGEKLQSNIDNGICELPEISVPSGNGAGDFRSILTLLEALEPIDAGWTEYLQKIIGMYDKVCNNKNDFLQNNMHIVKPLRNIAEYFIWRYFMKGAFDGEILSRVKLSVVSTAVIGYMYCCKGLENETLDLETCAFLAKNFSKEIEYSEENLEILLDSAYELDAMESSALNALLA